MYLVYILGIGLLWLVLLQILNILKVHIKDKNYKEITPIVAGSTFVGVLLFIIIFIVEKPMESIYGFFIGLIMFKIYERLNPFPK